MIWLAVALGIILGAALFRIRGGWLDVGSSTVGRLIWSVPLGLLAGGISWNPWALIVGPLLFLCVLPGWGSYMDLGRMPKPDNESIRFIVRVVPFPDGSFWYDFWGLTIRGLILTLPAGALLGYITGNYLFAGAGLLMAPLYMLGWKVKGTEIAEWLFGGWLGGMLAMSAWG